MSRTVNGSTAQAGMQAKADANKVNAAGLMRERINGKFMDDPMVRKMRVSNHQ
jgi:hypothetical protein